MQAPDLFWFRTRQSLLEEWGYVEGVWHLVKRSQLSLTILSIRRDGTPRLSLKGEPFELPESRIPLALIDFAQCDFRGPFSLRQLPAPGQLPMPAESMRQKTRSSKVA